MEQPFGDEVNPGNRRPAFFVIKQSENNVGQNSKDFIVGIIRERFRHEKHPLHILLASICLLQSFLAASHQIVSK